MLPHFGHSAMSEVERELIFAVLILWVNYFSQVYTIFKYDILDVIEILEFQSNPSITLHTIALLVDSTYL